MDLHELERKLEAEPAARAHHVRLFGEARRQGIMAPIEYVMCHFLKQAGNDTSFFKDMFSMYSRSAQFCMPDYAKGRSWLRDEMSFSPDREVYRKKTCQQTVKAHQTFESDLKLQHICGFDVKRGFEWIRHDLFAGEAGYFLRRVRVFGSGRAGVTQEGLKKMRSIWSLLKSGNITGHTVEWHCVDAYLLYKQMQIPRSVYHTLIVRAQVGKGRNAKRLVPCEQCGSIKPLESHSVEGFILVCAECGKNEPL